jgi:hypothetical protein
LTGDILYRRLAGVGKHENDAELERVACAAVDLIFGTARVDAHQGFSSTLRMPSLVEMA